MTINVLFILMSFHIILSKNYSSNEIMEYIEDIRAKDSLEHYFMVVDPEEYLEKAKRSLLFNFFKSLHKKNKLNLIAIILDEIQDEKSLSSFNKELIEILNSKGNKDDKYILITITVKNHFLLLTNSQNLKKDYSEEILNSFLLRSKDLLNNDKYFEAIFELAKSINFAEIKNKRNSETTDL